MTPEDHERITLDRRLRDARTALDHAEYDYCLRIDALDRNLKRKLITEREYQLLSEEANMNYARCKADYDKSFQEMTHDAP